MSGQASILNTVKRFLDGGVPLSTSNADGEQASVRTGLTPPQGPALAGRAQDKSSFKETRTHFQLSHLVPGLILSVSKGSSRALGLRGCSGQRGGSRDIPRMPFSQPGKHTKISTGA